MQFLCLHCGRCCDKILRTVYGITIGIYLRPSEKRLFKQFPDAVVPYVGVAKRGDNKPRRVVCYQVAVEPCPLYDKVTKTCTQYDSRPVACRAYPFELQGSRMSIESSCKWLGEHELEYGKTRIDAVEDIKNAFKLNQDFRRYPSKYPNLPVVMIFDIKEKEWVKIEHD